MDKSWELVHDSGNKVAVVGEANVDVIALNDLMSGVHAHVELGIDAVDLDVPNSVLIGVGSVRDSLSMTRVKSVFDGSVFFNISSLGECNTRK